MWEAEFAAKSKGVKAAVASPVQFTTPTLSAPAKSNKPVPYWVQDSSSVKTFKPLKFGDELEVDFDFCGLNKNIVYCLYYPVKTDVPKH